MTQANVELAGVLDSAGAGSLDDVKVDVPSRPTRQNNWLLAAGALVLLYFFLAAIGLMGHGLKSNIAKKNATFIRGAVSQYAGNPVAGLCVGVLVTAIVQSSSFTTSLVVVLVGAGQMGLVTAVPIIMGANIGTSVTNTLVSLAHIRRRHEFRRSLAGAVVHDQFNLLAVLVVMPLELAFGVLSKPALAFADWMKVGASEGVNIKNYNVFKMLVKPINGAMDWLCLDFLGVSHMTAGIIEAIVAVAILFVALIFLVKVLQRLMTDRLGGMFSKTFFRNGATSFIVGICATVAVQSSSVTTSLIIPLVGAGVLTIRQVFPYMLGANIGTTITAILAGLAGVALARGADGAVQAAAAGGLAIALAHLLFNAYGTIIFWPLKWMPISLAKGFAKMAMKRRFLAAVYIVGMFFLLPAVTIILIDIIWSS